MNDIKTTNLSLVLNFWLVLSQSFFLFNNISFIYNDTFFLTKKISNISLYGNEISCKLLTGEAEAGLVQVADRLSGLLGRRGFGRGSRGHSFGCH